MLSLPASKPQSPHKGSLGISLREDRTETRLMLSLPAVKPHSPHKRSLGIILREEKARLVGAHQKGLLLASYKPEVKASDAFSSLKMIPRDRFCGL